MYVRAQVHSKRPHLPVFPMELGHGRGCKVENFNGSPKPLRPAATAVASPDGRAGICGRGTSAREATIWASIVPAPHIFFVLALSTTSIVKKASATSMEPMYFEYIWTE